MIFDKFPDIKEKWQNGEKNLSEMDFRRTDQNSHTGRGDER